MNADVSNPTNGSVPPRRGFFGKFATVTLGAIVIAPPLAAGVMTWLHPLRGKDEAADGDDGFIEITTLAALPNDSIPRKFKVISDLHDAWTTTRNVPVGSVYLRRDTDDSVEALNAICPHAGCEVHVAENERFSCPCHDSDFDLDGTLRAKTKSGANSVSPRGLDVMDVKVADGRVLVKFQNFYTGISEKRAKG